MATRALRIAVLVAVSRVGFFAEGSLLDGYLVQPGEDVAEAVSFGFQQPVWKVANEETGVWASKAFNTSITDANTGYDAMLMKDGETGATGLWPWLDEWTYGQCDYEGMFSNGMRRERGWFKKNEIKGKHRSFVDSNVKFYKAYDKRKTDYPIDRDDCLRRAAGYLRPDHGSSDDALRKKLEDTMGGNANNAPSTTRRNAEDLQANWDALRTAAIDPQNLTKPLSRAIKKLLRGLKLMKDIYYAVYSKRQWLRDAKEKSKAGVVGADWNPKLRTAMRDFEGKLEAFDKQMLSLVVQSSRASDRDGLARFRLIANDMVSRNKRLLKTTQAAAAVRDKFIKTVGEKTQFAETSVVEKIANAERTQTLQASEAGTRVIGKFPGVEERQTSRFMNTVNRYSRNYDKLILKRSNALRTMLARNLNSRERVIAQLDPKLEKNMTEIINTANSAVAKANSEAIIPAIATLNSTERELKVMDLKFARDRDLAVFDANKLLNETVAALENVIHAYEDDWASSRRASTGDFGSLSNEFINRLASVGAAMKEEVADIQAGAAADLAEQTDVINELKLGQSASLGDVNRYMSGAAVQINDESAGMKELLITKKAELTAIVGFLKAFLLGRVQSGKSTFSEAIGELREVLSDVDKLMAANTPAAAKSAIDSAQQSMQSQLNALAMSGNIKAESMNALMEAMNAGNTEQFNRLLSAMTTADAALGDAVKRNLEVASLAAATAAEADGPRKVFLQNQLKEIMSNSTTLLDLARAQVFAQLTTAQTSLKGLSVSALGDFQNQADEAISVATTVATRVASPELTQQVATMMAPLLTRIDSLSQGIVPGVLAALYNYRTYLATKATVEDDAREAASAATSDAGVQALTDAAETYKVAMTGNMQDKLDVWNRTFNVFKNDTEAYAVSLPTSAADMALAIEDMKRAAQNATLTLRSLEDKTGIFNSVADLVTSSTADEASRVSEALPRNSMSSVRQALRTLWGSGNTSRASLTAAFNVFKAQLVADVTNYTGEALNIQRNFNASMTQFDVADAEFTRSLTQAEVDALLAAWGALHGFAPAVNQSMKTSQSVNMRGRVANSVQSVNQLRATNAAAFAYAIDAMNSKTGGNMTALFDDLFKSVEAAVNGSYALRDDVFSSYGKFDLAPVAESLRSVGAGIAALTGSSANLTSQASAAAAQIAASTKAQAGSASGVARLSAEAVTRMLSAFNAKKLQVDGTMNSKTAAYLNQAANLNAVLHIWSSLFDSALEATDNGYVDVAADAEALSTAIDAKVAENENFVTGKLDPIQSIINSERTLFSSMKLPRLNSISGIVTRLNTAKTGITNLQATIARRNTTADSAVANFKNSQGSFDSDLTAAVNTWNQGLTGAVQDLLSRVQPVV